MYLTISFMSNPPEYSDIEEVRNSVLALDTRVTNAINGGSLAPPVSYNVLLSPYTDSEEGTSVSANEFYHEYKRTTEYSRVWSNTYKVPQRGKLTASLSAAVVAYDGKINSVGLDVLNTAGSVILVASPNGTTDLSSLAGQTVKLRFKCTNTIHIAFRATFSVLTISNK